MAWRYTTFTWPTNPTWTADANYGYSTIITGVTGVTESSTPVLDPLISTLATKKDIENDWAHILDAETLSTSGQIKFYSDTNSLPNLNGVTIQVSGY